MPATIYKKCAVLLPFLLTPLFVSAEISKVVFITEPQTINPGDLSGVMSIQLQDSSGTAFKAPETIDIEFISSSPSGEFLSPTSESAVTKTISTNSANKNFRYRDSALGNQTITIKAKGRVSGLAWSAVQNINVGDPNDLPPTTDPGDSNEESQDSDNSEPSSSSSSSHFSSDSLSSIKPNKKISLGAGRDRTGSVGSPLEFQAETNLSYKNNSIFKWNFGDGTQGNGERITHTYEYPGEYVVVLGLATPEGRGIARVNVKIIDPQLAVIEATSEKIVIRNNSKQEVNLLGRALWSQGRCFIFPLDTIVKAGQNIAFSSKVTGLHPLNIDDAELVVLGETEQPELPKKMEEWKQEKVSKLQYQIWALQEELGSRLARSPNLANANAKASPNPTSSSTSSYQEKSASVAAVVETLPSESRKTGWLTVFRHFFLKNQNE